MPYSITWKDDGIVWTFHGVLTGGDAIQANLDIYGDPRFDELRYQIVDMSGVEAFAIATEDLETAAAMDDAATRSNPRLVVAVIATTREALEVAETYRAAMCSTSWQISIFSSMAGAEKWLRQG